MAEISILFSIATILFLSPFLSRYMRIPTPAIEIILGDDKKLVATTEAYNSVHPCCKYRDEEIITDHNGELKKQKKN